MVINVDDAGQVIVTRIPDLASCAGCRRSDYV